MCPKKFADKYMPIGASFTGQKRRFVAAQPASSKSIQLKIASQYKRISFVAYQEVCSLLNFILHIQDINTKS